MSNPRTKTLIDETMLMMRIVMNIEDDGECWSWKGATGSTGHPIIHLRQPFEGHTGCMLVRRLVYALNGGELISRQPIGSTCDDVMCVNPAHLYQSTISKIGKKAAKDGAWKGLDRAIRISNAKRAGAKLDIEKAREIRMSSESGPVLAERYGVNRSLVNNIKRGVIWRDYTNMFSGLGARA